MSDHRDVLILGAIEAERLSGTTWELLGCGRKLADKAEARLHCIIAGPGAGILSLSAIAGGADVVYASDDPHFQHYHPESYLPLVTEVAKQANPSIILLGHDDMGRDLAPRMAFKLAAGLCTDCIDISLDDQTGRLIHTRSVYGGNLMSASVANTGTQIATIRQKAMAPAKLDPDRVGSVISVDVGMDPCAFAIKVTDRTEEADVGGVKLEDAKVVISRGRGIGGPDGFKQLEQMARMLNGAVGASRPPCDSGWMPAARQIGLTGQIVAPDVYIAVALSGSSQHLAGCSGSKKIVAVNSDPEANIFSVADFGAVGDWKEILPSFMAKIDELNQG